jgi:hypothetical protein
MPWFSGPWLWANLGFDTTKKLWFVDLHNHKGTVQTYIAKNVILKDGYGTQYQWANRGPHAFWHVRERFFASDVKHINYDDSGNLVVESIRIESLSEEIPAGYSYLCYAFSRKTSRGFLEFFDADNRLLKRVNEMWIIVEDVTRKTIGEYPNIRIRVERESIRKIIFTKTAAIIMG